jgi:hypothetical protein
MELWITSSLSVRRTLKNWGVASAKIPLTHNSLFGIFNPPKSEFLSTWGLLG